MTDYQKGQFSVFLWAEICSCCGVQKTDPFLSYVCVLSESRSIKPVLQIRSSSIRSAASKFFRRHWKRKQCWCEGLSSLYESTCCGGLQWSWMKGQWAVQSNVIDLRVCRVSWSQATASTGTPGKVVPVINQTGVCIEHTRTQRPLQQACIFHEESKNKYFIQVCNVNSIMHLFFDLLSFEAVWMQRWWNNSRASNRTNHLA